MEEIKRKHMGTYDIIYHKSQLKCTERPGDDPKSARGFDLNPQQKILSYQAGQVVEDYTVPIDFDIHKNIRVPMRDGIRLCGDLALPKVPEKVPAVLIWTPFGKDKEYMAPPPFEMEEDDKAHEADIAAEIKRNQGKTSPWSIPHGPDAMTFIQNHYAVVTMDLRGACNSEGDAEYFGNGQDSDDLCDAIQWLSEQAWCNGKVATTGCSWIAMASWYASAKHPKNLACIAPFEGHSNMYRDEYMRMGIRDIGFARNFFTPGYTYQEHIRGLMEEYPVWNDFWESKRCPLEKIEVPMLITVGYYSYYHVRGTFEAFQKSSSREKWLHINPVGGYDKIVDATYMEDVIRFFDHYCKDIDNGWEATPRVRLSLLQPGRDPIVDRAEADWPIPRTKYTKLYLDAATGTMGLTQPQQSSSISYDTELEHPRFSNVKDIFENDPLSGRAEFTYTFPQDTELVGTMELKCYVEAQGHDDMDLFVHMVFLDENDQILYTEGEHKFGYTGPDNRLRVSLRALDEARSTPHFPEQSFKVMEKLQPGQIVPIDIQIWPTGVKFRAGQKLRLVIAGYDYMGHPLPGGENTRFKPDNKGIHVIHTGGQYDSFLSIPTI